MASASNSGGRQKPSEDRPETPQRPLAEFTNSELVNELNRRSISFALSMHVIGEGNKDEWFSLVRGGLYSLGTHHARLHKLIDAEAAAKQAKRSKE